MSTPRPAELAETHSAVVVFFGDRAYKVKKHVDLGFLDFRSRATREAVCHREVELNRRLAPDVYLGVSDVLDVDGRPCDHLVVMRRMPLERRLATLVQEGEPVDDHLWQLAHRLAAFHSRSEHSPDIDRAASVEALTGRWADNTAVLVDAAGRLVDADLVERVDTLAGRYLAGRGPLFEQRLADGRAVDGHGDLLADDIFCLDDGPRVLDCIEFNDEFRYGDALADVAFLAMDLERLGRPDLAGTFLAAYREHADDTWPASLAHHHVGYRAHVRAKVSAIRADQGDETAADDARSLLELAATHLDQARVRLVLVGGLPGTGKSTLALGLGDALAATVLRSDEVRKELAGLPPGASAAAPYEQGLYSPGKRAATYRALLDRARVALGLGETVILDASWGDAERRGEAAELAGDTTSELVELRCEAPAEVAAARLRERAASADGAGAAAGDPSDATPEIATRMAADVAPWPSAHTVDTSGDPEQALATALDVVA
jgi:aminoglycoside phosphotransferase family enzyme/predicted kinase